MGELLGYARVSTAEQNADLQRDALTAAGCWKVYVDHASGALDRRPQLDRVRTCARGTPLRDAERETRTGRRANLPTCIRRPCR
jgi:hypothetical protein